MTFRATTFSPGELACSLDSENVCRPPSAGGGTSNAKLLQGTLDMLIFKALYPALQRLTNQGRVETTWGTSEKNQSARSSTV